MELPQTSPQDSTHQARGQAWNPLRPDVRDLLQSSLPIELAPIYYGSNHCFLVTLDAGSEGRSLAVYKPARGEYPLYDFPGGTLYKREVASELLDSILQWNLVPPTIVTRGAYGVGSLQLFIESYAEGELTNAELQRLALLDIVLNNADRKADHCLLGERGKLWGIDHGLTFHPHPKLRTVLWHFAGRPIAPSDLADLRSLLADLQDRKGPEIAQLSELISRVEWRALADRLDRLIGLGRFPDPRYKSVPYRW